MVKTRIITITGILAAFMAPSQTVYSQDGSPWALWLETLGNNVPNEHQIPVGLALIPVGLTYQKHSERLPAKLNKISVPQITKRTVINNKIIKTAIPNSGSTYILAPQDIPTVKITTLLHSIDGYALVDENMSIVKSWSYIDGRLMLN